MSQVQHTLELLLENEIIKNNQSKKVKKGKKKKQNNQDKNKAYNKAELNSNTSIITLNRNDLVFQLKDIVKIKCNYMLFMSNTSKNIR